MATAPRPLPFLIEDAGYEALDGVMLVMNRAFDPHNGEAWTRSQCAGILPMAGVSLVVARTADEAGDVIGFSLQRTTLDEAELLLLAVDPEAQGQGVGRALMERFELDCAGAGARRLHLEVRESNPATNFYETKGFVLGGRRRGYYRGDEGDRIDALTYVKLL